MNTKAKYFSKIALTVCGIVGLAGTSALASDKLLKVLEDNQVITAAQAEEIKAAQPKYRVRPASGVVKDLQIRGRVQAQFGYVDAKNDEGSSDYSTFEMRRVRMGMRGTLFDSVRAQLEANLVPGSDFSMRSAFLQWREYKPMYIKLGYDKPHSSIEENTSSAKILTVERSVINGLVAAPGPTTGISLDGDVPLLVYGAGVYTDADNRNKDNEDSKYMFNAMAGLKLGELIDDKVKFLVRANYLKSNDESGKVGSKFDKDVVTCGAHLGMGPFDLRGEFMQGDDDGSKTKGWYITPSFKITDKLQAVARYEQAKSDDAKGIRAPSRYVRKASDLKVRETKDDDGKVISKFDPQRGDEYQALYIGLNYYISGHAHKLMLGVEFAELKNTDAGKLKSTTAYSAWRMLF